MLRFHLLLALVVVTTSLARAQAGELARPIACERGEVQLTVRYPTEAYERWAAVVADYVERGLPLLEQAAGFPFPLETLSVEASTDPADTHGLDAWHVSGDRIAALRIGKRKGMRGHRLLGAIAHIFGERVSTEPWLQHALAELYTVRALEKAHWIYHAWTLRDELVEDARRAGAPKLEGWKPAGMVGDEYLTAFGPAAWGFSMLFAANTGIGDDAVFAAAKRRATEAGPGSLFDFLDALEQAAGKSVREYFVGWAYEGGGDDPAAVLHAAAIADLDDDGLLECEEAAAGTDATSADTDTDTRLDGEEVHDDHTDPLKADPPPGPVRFDGDPREWLRMKKFKVTDKKGDSRTKDRGTDLHAVALACDADFLYLLVMADAMDNPKVKYTLVLDTQDDGVWDYAIGFRSTRHRWIGVTHNDRDWSWAEWRNDRRMSLMVAPGGVAEMRIPRPALQLGERPRFMVYTSLRTEDGKTVYGDATLREHFDVARWQQ